MIRKTVLCTAVAVGGLLAGLGAGVASADPMPLTPVPAMDRTADGQAPNADVAATCVPAPGVTNGTNVGSACSLS